MCTLFYLHVYTYLALRDASSPELELEMAVSCYVDGGNRAWIPRKSC